MSQALYKYLRKLQLAGNPEGDKLMGLFEPNARALIMRRLAAIKGKGGEGAFRPWEPGKYQIGDKARAMLEEAEAASSRAQPTGALNDEWTGAASRWDDWLNGIRRED